MQSSAPSTVQFSPLSKFKHRVAIAASLPFNVYDADRTLLLARGQWVENFEQMSALFERGALVDIAELRDPAVEARLAKPTELPGLWNRNLHQLGETLRHAAGDEAFVDALDATTPAVVTLIERDRDLAVFQVLRQEGNAMAQYGVNRSMHAAITALLVAQRLGWSADDAQRAFKAALTMNISMLELQGELAQQSTPLTDEQRDAVRAHPDFSRLMLELSGVTDPEWLRAVAEHHEVSDGSGYPGGLRQVSDTAELVRRADIYTAKLSPRGTRQAMAADQAGRQMFMQDPGHPMTAALVKEFGVYPPGCYVRLESGECGLVVRRGPTVTTPVVAVMSTPSGSKLRQPIRRDTSVKGHAIQAVISGQMMHSGISPEMLVMLAAG